jgi:hypothetical protein
MNPTPLNIEIVVIEGLNQDTSAWFEDLYLSALPDDCTRLSGTVPDQTALHGILARIRDLNLTLASVQVS